MNVATASIAGVRPRVLIVENDAAVRRSMQLLLQGHGFDVKAYGASEQLLVDAARQSPDCFIADYRLDGPDGIAVLKAMREQGWQGPAILITGFPSEDLSSRATEAGFTCIFEKPLRERALVETVSRLAHRQDGGG